MALAVRLILIFTVGCSCAVRTTVNVRHKALASTTESLRAEPLSEVQSRKEEPSAAKGAFTDIYNKQVWGSAGGGSGTGSTKEMTTSAISIIRLVANTYNLRSLIDTPCGAFTWQPLLLQLLEDDFSDFKYMGVDVVEHVIEKNKQEHADRKKWTFLTRDLSAEEIPKGYDLLMSRDALQHLPCKTAVKMLRNIAASKPQYLLLGSYDDEVNVNISMGEYYSINLRKAPFNMQDGVLRVYSEHNLMINPGELNKNFLLFSGQYMQSLDYDSMEQGCMLLA